jgi:catechol 2,3-dioxygenase-like lactoylglutathione lyase family enzyme
MPLARFTKICVDASDPATVGSFWANALGEAWRPDDDGEEGGVYGKHGVGDDPVLRIKKVPEPKTVKNRVHLDIYCASLDELIRLGATVLVPEGDDRRWTVMVAPEGGEFCAFVRDPVPAERLHGMGVDCADPERLARWWVDVLGGEVEDHPEEDRPTWATANGVPGMAFTLDFDRVPEPKTVKNRVHWDVAAPDVAPLLCAGAVLLREPDDEIDFAVLSDPEGNEFCVFPD